MDAPRGRQICPYDINKVRARRPPHAERVRNWKEATRPRRRLMVGAVREIMTAL